MSGVGPIARDAAAPRVLNVNGEEAPLADASRRLREAGFAVLEARTGREAVRLAASERPDAVLLDVRLPDIGGVEVCRQLRANPPTASIAILLVSPCSVEDADRVDGLETGADAYLIEPLSSRILASTLRALLRARRAGAAAPRAGVRAVVAYDLTGQPRGEEALRDGGREAEPRLAERAPTHDAEGGADEMTGRQRAESALEAAGRLNRTITDNATVALFVLDARQHCAFMNPAAEHLTGYTLAEVQGRPLHEFVHHTRPDGRPYPTAECPIARVFPQNSREHGEEVLVHKDGHFYPVAYAASPILEAGRPAGTIVEVLDITERKALEAQLRELLRREQEQRKAAEAASRRKDEFVAMLGHELRNPLGAIASAMGVLDRMGTQSALAAASRAIVKRQLAHLTRIMDDLLDVARIITGKIVLAREPLDLAAVVGGCVQDRLAAEGFVHHRMDVRLEPAWVSADPARLEQVISNLLTNAVKYTPADGTIAVRTTAERDDAVLRVSDSGIGMAADLVPTVFELFVQGDRGLDRSAGGLGIGLTLVQRLVEGHGGRVEAYSEGPGRGSTFTVRLPRIEPAPGMEPPSEAAPPAGERRRVLLVEDHADGREALRTVLELAGHEVFEAATGSEGVRAALELKPEVVLIDIGLPGLDGYEVARRLREAVASRPRLVAVTGYGRPEDRHRAYQAGFDVHLVKPVTPEDVLRALDGSPDAP